MKHLLLTPLLFIVLSTTAWSQYRASSGYFENPPAATTSYERTGGSRPRIAPPPAARSVRPTAAVTLTVHDGYPTVESRYVYERVPVKATAKLMQPPPAPQMAGRKYLKGYSTGNGAIDQYIVASSNRYNIDPLLIYAQMSQESGFKVRALSHKGASGLMQLIPATARRMGVRDIYDPEQNIEGGVKYMRLLLDMFGGDLNLALAGYNAGEGAVIRYGHRIPPFAETQHYVRAISARYRSISNSSRGYVRKN